MYKQADHRLLTAENRCNKRDQQNRGGILLLCKQLIRTKVRDTKTTTTTKQTERTELDTILQKTENNFFSFCFSFLPHSQHCSQMFTMMTLCVTSASLLLTLVLPGECCTVSRRHFNSAQLSHSLELSLDSFHPTPTHYTLPCHSLHR